MAKKKWNLWNGGIIGLIKNLKDGYQFGDLSAGVLGFTDSSNSWWKPEAETLSGGTQLQTVNDKITDAFNNHNVSDTLDPNGYQQVEITPADPTSSASNVINYDPNKSAMENMLGYAQANNSASAYNTYLQNQYNTEMSNTALSRAIADAEANGISKYQLFQSGNAAASTPSSGSSMYQSYENAMNRRESWNEKEIQAITSIITATISAAGKLFK